jgi:predicted RNA-binding Zn-ribbon protein involved in translation (DUF1610 family)
MRVRPGKTRSLIGGILMLVVMIVGLVMMPGTMGIGGPIGSAVGIFKILWIAVGLIGAAVSFYNAFSEQGVPLYEVDVDSTSESDVIQSGGNGRSADVYCPQCGNAVQEDDKFCRHCGTSLQ